MLELDGRRQTLGRGRSWCCLLQGAPGWCLTPTDTCFHITPLEKLNISSFWPVVRMEEAEEEEEVTRHPRKELIFSSLPFAHALTLQVLFLFCWFPIICEPGTWGHIILYMYVSQARGKVCEGCLSPANPFTECSNCLASHCSTECRFSIEIDHSSDVDKRHPLQVKWSDAHVILSIPSPLLATRTKSGRLRLL